MKELRTKKELINFVENTQNTDFVYIENIVDVSYGNYSRHYRCRIGTKADGIDYLEGFINDRFVEDLTDADGKWIVINLFRQIFGLNYSEAKKEIKETRAEEKYNPSEAKDAQWADALGFED